MAYLTLTGQATLSGPIQTRVNQLKTAMDARQAVWDKLPDAKKKKWVTSGKDPIMTLSWEIYKYLRNNFFSQEVDNG
jgi:hypothetical protein